MNGLKRVSHQDIKYRLSHIQDLCDKAKTMVDRDHGEFWDLAEEIINEAGLIVEAAEINASFED